MVVYAQHRGKGRSLRHQLVVTLDSIVKNGMPKYMQGLRDKQARWNKFSAHTLSMATPSEHSRTPGR